MNFIFIFISSSDPNLLRKKLVKQNIKKSLALGVVRDSKTVEIPLFNDVVLHFLQATLSMMKENKDNADMLVEPLEKNSYSFQIVAGKTKGEFICQETTMVEKNLEFEENNSTDEVFGCQTMHRKTKHLNVLTSNDQTRNATKSGNVKTSKYLKYHIKIATKHQICHFSGATVNRIYH